MSRNRPERVCVQQFLARALHLTLSMNADIASVPITL